MKKKKFLALIGYGYWGKNLARDFNSLGVLKAISDINYKTKSEVKKISEDIGRFIFEYIDEIEELNSIVPKGYDEDEANQRMDIIGQNGPTGEHYDKNQTELEL